jgi:hypothetical protein
MSIKMNIDIVPWMTPNFVSVKMPSRPRQEGFNEGIRYALNELDEQTLSELCDNFRKEVFEKAGKKDPKKEI